MVTLISCASLNKLNDGYGGFVQSPAVEKSFLNAAPNPDYGYYTYGPHDFPDVLMGLDKKYIPYSGVFTAIGLSPESMKVLVDRMQHRATAQTDILRGFNIVDEKGNVIGTWYSPFLFRSTVLVKGGVVEISAPEFPNRPFGKPSADSDFN